MPPSLPQRDAAAYARNILIGTALCWGVVALFFLLVNQPYYPVIQIVRGNDFRFFFGAAQLFVAGHSPYMHPFFFSPPTAALLLGSLSSAPFLAAYLGLVAATAGGLLTALFLSVRALYGRFRDAPEAAPWGMFWATAATLCLGLPFQFLVERGNLDGLVLFFTVAGLALLKRNEWFSGVLIALGAALKIYSGLIFLPLLLAGRWRAVCGGGLTLALLGLNTLEYWPDFFARFAKRDALFMTSENASFPAFFATAGRALFGEDAPTGPLKTAGLLLFIGLLAVRLLRDAKGREEILRNPLPRLSLYFPLCVSIPSIVHNYELVFLLPLVPVLAICHARAEGRRERLASGLAGAGVVMSQFHAYALVQATGIAALALIPQAGLVVAAAICASGLLDPALARSKNRERQRIEPERAPSPPPAHVRSPRELVSVSAPEALPPRDVRQGIPIPSSPTRFRRVWLLAGAVAGIAVWLALFSPAIFGGQRYGNLPRHQIFCLALQNPALGDSSAALPDRLPHLVDYDHHLLLEPDLMAVLAAWRNGRIPLVDHTRGLGVPLWGSVIADFGNPLNPLLCALDAGSAHLAKLLVYFAGGWAGMLYLLCRVCGRSLWAGIAGSAIYFLNPYLFFFLHCANFVGVVALLPWLVAFLLRLLSGGGWLACAGFAGAFAGMILCNFAQLTVYCGLFCGVVASAFLAANRREWRAMVPRLAALLLSSAAAVGLAWFALGPMLETSAGMARSGTPFHPGRYPYLPLPDLGEIIRGAFLPSPHIRGDFWREPYFPAPFLFLAAIGLGAVRGMPRAVRSGVIAIALFYGIYFFVGWIDLPLWAGAGKLYAPNPLQLRGLAILYLLFAGLVAIGWDVFFGRGEVRGVSRAWASVLAALACLIALLAWRGPVDIVRWLYGFNPFLSSQANQAGFWLFLIACAGGCALFYWGKPLPALAALVVAGVAYGSSRLAFYEPSQALPRLAEEAGERELATRVTRGIDIGMLAVMPFNSDHRQFHDAIFSTLGVAGFTGYHTSMSKRELAVYDLFAGADYRGDTGRKGFRDLDNFRDYGLGYFHGFFFREAAMKDGLWDEGQRLRLSLLGVSKVTAEKLHGSPLESEGDLTGAKKPVHLLPNTSPEAARSLFLARSSGTPPPQLPDPVGLRATFDPRSGVYSVDLTGEEGTVVFPYNLGRFFRCTIDGRHAEAAPDPDFAFWLIPVGKDSTTIAFHPDCRPLLAPAIGGIAAGLLLLFAAGKCSGGRARQQRPAS